MRAISIGVLIDIFYVEKLSSRAILIPSFSSTLLSKNAPMIKNIISDTKKQSYGIQFENLDTKLADTITAYVNDVFDYQAN